MNSRVLIAAAGLPVLALVAVVYWSAKSDAPVSPTVPADEAKLTGGSAADWVREPFGFDDPERIAAEIAAAVERDRQVIIAEGAAAEARIRSDIERRIEQQLQSARSNEIERQAETQERQWALLQARATVLDQYREDPEWPVVPALPGVNGFPIKVCPYFTACLSDRLANEEDDPDWARSMESRLLAEVARHAAGGLSQVHVVCRRTTCGVLLPSAAGTTRPDIEQLKAQLAPALGFVASRSAELGDFQAIYLTTDEVELPFFFEQW